MKNGHPQKSEMTACLNAAIVSNPTDTDNQNRPVTSNAQPNKDDFKPIFPTHDTQAARLLAVSLLAQKINPLRGWRSLGIYRLSDTKFRLKEMGWPMESNRLDVSNKFGEACRVALYGLPDWAIELAGNYGQEFAQRELEIMANRKAT